MNVSIIICSLNSVDDHIHKINSRNSKGLSYEIIVCSDITTRGLDNVRYVTDPKTSVKAFNLCYKQSSGDFVFTFPGGVTTRDDMFDMVYYLNSLKYKASAFSGDGGDPSWIPRWAAKKAYNNKKGLEKLCGRCQQQAQLQNMYRLYRSQILRYPAFHRDFIENYLGGVIFNESFIHHYVDNWLGVFCGKHFGSIENSSLRIVTEKHKSIHKYNKHDEQIFDKLLQNADPYNYNYKVY